jgi:hypothetical protein
VASVVNIVPFEDGLRVELATEMVDADRACKMECVKTEGEAY